MAPWPSVDRVLGSPDDRHCSGRSLVVLPITRSIFKPYIAISNPAPTPDRRPVSRRRSMGPGYVSGVQRPSPTIPSLRDGPGTVRTEPVSVRHGRSLGWISAPAFATRTGRPASGIHEIESVSHPRSLAPRSWISGFGLLPPVPASERCSMGSTKGGPKPEDRIRYRGIWFISWSVSDFDVQRTARLRPAGPVSAREGPVGDVRSVNAPLRDSSAHRPLESVFARSLDFDSPSARRFPGTCPGPAVVR